MWTATDYNDEAEGSNVPPCSVCGGKRAEHWDHRGTESYLKLVCTKCRLETKFGPI